MDAPGAERPKTRPPLEHADLELLAGLSAGVVEGGAVGGRDELDCAACKGALEAFAGRTENVVEQLQLWLGAEDAARERAQLLQQVLVARATVVLLSDPAGAGAALASLQRLGFLLGDLVARSAVAPGQGASREQLMAERLREEISRARAADEGVAVLRVRCDAIEKLDLSMGYRAGDELREAIVRRIRADVLRGRDAIGVVSREELVCLVRPVGADGVALLAGQKILKVLAPPLAFGRHAAAPEAAVGIAIFPEHGTDPETLLQRAKAALRAARAGASRCELYRHDLQDADASTLRHVERLRNAIGENLLTLHFQPQADVRSGRIVGAESLLRWHDEVLGQVPPNVAVAAAESSGLIQDLTPWVITAAVQKCAEFQRIDPAFTVSVNVSPSNLHEADLPHHIDRALRTWGVRGKSLVLEVTETAIVRDQKVAMDALRELKKCGVGVSIDDFGTGYSSMYYLVQMPLDELKIDLMFVRGMLESPDHAKIVRSLIELSHNLELTVVAEGVENEAILSALAHLGCDRVQGYHIGKPMPAHELLTRLRSAANS